MKRALIVSLIACGVLATGSYAQKSIKFLGSQGWGIGSTYDMLFNNYNLQVITGTVFSMDTVTPLDGMAPGIQLIVKDNNGQETYVQLGPRWYIVFQDANLKPGDQVQVTGARFSCNGKDVYAAFQVQTPDRIMILRDQDGHPYWCGWRLPSISGLVKRGQCVQPSPLPCMFDAFNRSDNLSDGDF